MDVSEAELREMVRAAIAKRDAVGAAPTHAEFAHASHGLLLLPSGGDETGACIIEPSVPCTHCGYCLSLGH
jgi:hypothetical protein